MCKLFAVILEGTPNRPCLFSPSTVNLDVHRERTVHAISVLAEMSCTLRVVQ